jgi:hypothetical protein
VHPPSLSRTSWWRTQSLQTSLRFLVARRLRKIPWHQPIYQGIRRIPGFWPTPDIAQASELLSESESSGANSLNIGSGNNREVREISPLITLLG